MSVPLRKQLQAVLAAELRAGYPRTLVAEVVAELSAGSDLRKEASHEAFIAGHPAGAVCARCARSWRASWDAAYEAVAA